LTHIAGNIPGLTGYASQYQSSFYRSSLIGLWLASATVAVVYFVIPRLGGRPPLRATRLSVFGIWSLGFIWAMTAPAELTFGAAGDWLETIGVIFSIVLFLPIVVIATDLTHAMRGAWQNVRDRAGLRFIMSGLAMIAIYAVFNLLHALRASAAVVGFTDWVAAEEVLVLLGPFTFVLIGFLRLTTSEVAERAPGTGLIGYRIALAGIGLSVAAMAVAGIQTGFTWAGAANSAEFVNFGTGWVSTAGPLEGNYIVQLAGLIVLAVGLGASIRSALGGGSDSLAAEASPAVETEPDLLLPNPPSLQKVRRYAYGFFALAALLVLVLPALESEGPTLLAESRDYRSNPVLATGRTIYVQEGCVYCHTQQVRPIITDVGLGPVSVLGDYAKETPALIGVQRYGPDLAHLAERADQAAVAAHLRSPRDGRPWSTMPSYDYLGSEDLAALAAYLVGEE
jgi:cytochrome c oxidase cbb3-type subunit I/II